MKRGTVKRLDDVRSACQELAAYCAGKTADEFSRDRGLNLIIHKLFEIVGEALHQAEVIEPDVARQIPDLHFFVETGDRIANDYESVNYGVLWDIVHIRIPELEVTLTGILNTAVIDEED